jgi:hypothetical protein
VAVAALGIGGGGKWWVGTLGPYKYGCGTRLWGSTPSAAKHGVQARWPGLGQRRKVRRDDA